MTLLDAHVHVWDTGALDYPWLGGETTLAQRYLASDTDRAEGAATRAVFVEADGLSDRGVDEARWVAGLDWPELVGIVARADLGMGDGPELAATLDALQGIELVVGVRWLLQGIPAEEWPVAALAEGLRALAPRSLTFDACVRAGQLPALAALLELAPETDVVLDHLGKPPVDAGLESDAGRAWRAALDRVAALPRVHVKLSGLAAESQDAAAYDAHVDAFLAAGIEAFGPRRCMIGSDWPVSAHTGVGTTLRTWADSVRRHVGDGGREWADVAGRTAERFYGLATTHPADRRGVSATAHLE